MSLDEEVPERVRPRPAERVADPRAATVTGSRAGLVRTGAGRAHVGDTAQNEGVATSEPAQSRRITRH